MWFSIFLLTFLRVAISSDYGRFKTFFFSRDRFLFHLVKNVCLHRFSKLSANNFLSISLTSSKFIFFKLVIYWTFIFFNLLEHTMWRVFVDSTLFFRNYKIKVLILTLENFYVPDLKFLFTKKGKTIRNINIKNICFRKVMKKP